MNLSQQQIAGLPVVMASSRDLMLFAGMAVTLMDKHPESANEMLTQWIGKPPPEGFTQEFMAFAATFVLTMKQVAEQSEQLQAQAELEALPKERVN